MLQYKPSGDSAFIIKVGDEISEEINQTVRKLLVCIEQKKIHGLIDFIPSYNELMICYDPLLIGYSKLLDTIRSLVDGVEKIVLPASSVIHVPIRYGGDFGPDLNEVADINGLSVDEIIKIHSSASYLVYMLGFTPGFCYLGGMDKRIATPRKQTPRLKIPAGTVGIADQQTGIYPVESPGGWQLIGQTPLRLFNPGRKPEFLFQQGDSIQFHAITDDDFKRISDEVNRETYRVEISKQP